MTQEINGTKVRRARLTLPEREQKLLEDLRRVQTRQVEALKAELNGLADAAQKLAMRSGRKACSELVAQAAGLLSKAAESIKAEIPQ